MYKRSKTKFWGIFVLATALSLAWLALIYTLHHPEVLVSLTSIGWNG